jgi:hypothetical protein
MYLGPGRYGLRRDGIRVIISLAVGFGLMALLFYSKAYEEPPVSAVGSNDS